MLRSEAMADDEAHASLSLVTKTAKITVPVRPSPTPRSSSSQFVSMIQPPPLPPSESSTVAKKPEFFEAVLRNRTRGEEECICLANGIPKPPSGYKFSRRQIEEQINFFKYKKEAHVLPSNLIDCYRYTIIAVCKY